MKLTNPRIERLKQLMSMEEEREKMQQNIEALSQQMNALRDSLFDSTNGEEAVSAPVFTATHRNGSANGSSSAPTPTKHAKPRGGARRMKRGALKEQIVTALQSAGSEGIRVKELAEELAIKPVNIHSWFHSALSRYPQIKKITGGHYRLEGSIDGSNDGSSARNTENKESTSATRSTKNGSSRSTAKSHSKRGELSGRILSELREAGAKGINVRELATKIGAPYKNIYIWFSTTGKKNNQVKKLGPAHYKLTN